MSETRLDPVDELDEDQDDSIVGRALAWSLAAMALAGIAVAGVTWLNRPEPTPPEDEPAVAPAQSRAASPAELPAIPFTDVTEAAGVAFVHESGARGEKLLPETMGGGVAFLDYDGDGDQDLLFTNGRRWPWDESDSDPPAFPALVLYRNDGAGHFEDVTAEAGLDVDGYAMGLAAADYDGDGHLDLFVSCLERNRLFRGNGERFDDVTETAGVGGGDSDWSTSCGWFDFDRDGDLDLFVANYVVWSRGVDASQDFTLKGGGRAYGRPQNFEGTFSFLYRNEGDGRFTEVAEAAGMHVRNADTGAPMAKSLGVAFVDVDEDGWLDVIVANDTVRNFLFHNQRDGTFLEVGALAGIAFDPAGNARGAMGIDAAALREDGSLGVAIGNFSNEMTALYVSRPGELRFADEANANGLGPATRLDLTFGTVFLDADLDGRRDLFFANGHLEEDVHLVQTSQHYEQPPRLFWNAGAELDTEFVPLPAEKVGPDLGRPMVGRGAACGDFDGDGDEDLVIAACGRRPRLLRNDQQLGRHWLRVELVGEATNRDAIGSRIRLELADGRTLRAGVTPTRSYLSQSAVAPTFGLGDRADIERLVVTWPDGTRTTVDEPPVDRATSVRKPIAERTPAARRRPGQDSTE